jgi:predicted nucleotidyltransferase component of viral defense system
MKELINDIAIRFDIKRRDLLEKDIFIQNILLDLVEDDFFSKNFAFKGGTCLIKCYLGYYRFSEDIDFTWINQSVFKDKSQKEIRRIVSDYKDKVGKLLINISKNSGFDFVLDKDNRNYIEFGGGNKFVTFKVWFDSEILKRKSFIKIQVNFVEDIKFEISKKKVRNLLTDYEDKELEVLYDIDYKNYTTIIELLTYDVKEIVCEKVRAILTRRGIKARDFVDIYLISRKYGIKIQGLKKEITEKIKLMLELYQKYRTNLVEKIKLLESDDLFEWGTEKELLLKDINEEKFSRFVKEFQEFLKKLGKDIV